MSGIFEEASEASTLQKTNILKEMDTEVANKMTQVGQLLEQTYKSRKKGKSSSGYVIGLFTTLPQSDISWIDTELRRAGELIKEIKYVNPTNMKTNVFEKAVSECTFCMYICSEQKWKHVLSRSDKKKALSSFGKKKLILLIIDMLDSSDEEKNRIIKDQSHIKDYVLGLFLFKKIEEKPDESQDTGDDRGLQGGSSERKSSAVSLDQFRNLPFRLPQPTPVHSTGHQTEMTQRLMDRKPVVGIFSRSAEEDYEWLVRLLKEAFQDFAVSSCYISNNGYQQLRDGMSQCTFGILYHTKNRGRVNITDVKESLYDEELETLSAELGRKNIIVLIDDLEDSTDELKRQILQTQPSINKLACDLILISDSEKANKLKLLTKLQTIKFISGGENSGQKLLNSGNPEPYTHPPNPHLERRYTEKGAGENYGQNLQNAGNPDPYTHPPNPHLERRYTAKVAGNASPIQTRERMPNAVTTSSKPTVAIYSNSVESDFFWLSHELSSRGLDVRSYKISSFNKDHPQETAFQCKLVILYHNMYNGKLRLTDAKDAMYHEELEMLSTKFGKRRMIVVIDDLVESNEKIKAQILERQPSTGRFAKEIFLFSSEEKKHLSRFDTTRDGRKLMEKIDAIKEMLNK